MSSPKDASSNKEIIMQGYLEKKSPKAVLGVRAWQKRYFELVLQSSAARGNEISLFYHKSESDAGKEPLGEIVLNEIKSVQVKKDKGEGRFDVEVPSRVFALRCDKPEELKKWVSTLESMSQMANFKKPTNLPSTPAETMRLMAQNSLNNPSKSNESKFGDASDTLELMTKGQAFIRYQYEDVTEQTTREIVLLFYKKDSTPLGSLYFCEPGTKTEDTETALSLHTLTDLYLGKQSKAFKSAIGANAEAKKCFTAVGSNRNQQPRELNLEGDSKEQVAAWLFGINAILTHKGGRKVMTAEDSEKEEARKKAAAAKAAEQKQLEEQQRVAQEAERKAQAEAERAQAVAAAEAERNAAEQRAAQSAQEKAAAEKRAADAIAAAEAATAAAQRATAEAEAAKAATLAAAAEAAAERAAAEERLAAAAAAEAAAAPAGVVRIRRKTKAADGSTVPSDAQDGLSQDMGDLSIQPEEENANTWLASLGDVYPAEYSKLFKDNGVDLHFLVGLSAEELQEMGVKNNLHLKKMLAGIEKLNESGKYNKAPKILPTQAEAVPPTPTNAAAAAPADEPAAAAPAAAAAAAPVQIPESAVGQFLYKLGPAFTQYIKTFEDNGVDLSFLLTLNDDDLEELGVSKLHRKKMVQEIKETRAQSKENAASGAPAAPAQGGGYLARAAAKSSATAPVAASSSVNTKDDILAAIKEAKAKKEAAGGSQQPAPADDIDLAGTSIAAIAARMAAQREARAKEKAAAGGGQ